MKSSVTVTVSPTLRPTPVALSKMRVSRDAFDISEDVLQPLADAFCRFSAEYLRIAVVAVGKRNDKIFAPQTFTIHIEIGFSEIDFRIPWFPYELLRRFILNVFPYDLHIPLYCFIAPGISFLADQTVIDPPGSMVLLLPVFPVFIEPAGNGLLVWIKYRLVLL